MKDIEKRLESVCRQVGAFWDGGDGRYFLWKGEKMSELWVERDDDGSYTYDLLGVDTEVITSSNWREIRKRIVEFFL
jgi:hypothetical protein